MLAGLPIVATHAGAVPELIEDGKHGLLVQPGSAIELCEAMLRMLDDDTNRQQYGKQAQQRALTEFVPQKELAAFWEIYHECTGPHPYAGVFGVPH
jgi:glycosyltransferase involved in cell wall biosynthesis